MAYNTSQLSAAGPTWRPGMRLAVTAIIAAAALAVGTARADAATTAKVTAGTLTIQGDGGDNRIALAIGSTAPDLLRIDIGDDGIADFAIKRDKFTKIAVKAGGGADTVRIDESGGVFTDTEQTTIEGEGGADTITGGSGSELILGGDDNDTIDPRRGADVAFLGAGDDKVTWNPGDGSDTLEGQSGTDTMAFTGSNASEGVSLAANGQRLRLFRDVAAVTIDADGIEQADLATLGGSDTVTVGDLSGTAVTRVRPDLAGSVGGATGDGAADKVFVNGTAGADVIGIARSVATPDPIVSGLPATVTSAHLDSSVDTLNVLGSGGTDKLTVDESNGAISPLVLDGGEGDDALSGSSGPDSLFGGAGNDTLLGKGSPDSILGGDGNDTITGGDGDDANLRGEGGNDTFAWNPGDDTDSAEGDDGTDKMEVNGGNGTESFSVIPNGTRVRVDRLSPAPFALDLGSMENVAVQANGGDDTVTGANGLAAITQLTVDGGAGFDTLTGGDGNDVILGGDGNDTVAPGRGNDLALMGAGDDKATWNPGDGSDALEGQSGTDTMDFNGSNAGEHIDLSANGGRLRLFRDVAAITMDVDGIENADIATLGGADTVDVGDLSGTAVTHVTPDLASTLGGTTGDAQPDTVAVNATQGSDAIAITRDAATPDPTVSGLAASVSVTHREFTGDVLAVNGRGGDDTVTVNESNGAISPVVLDGGDGDDTLSGSSGSDTLTGGAGNDALLGKASPDTIRGGDGHDTVTGGDGDDADLHGDAGDDVFVWNPGDDTDTAEGDEGTDRLQLNGGNGAESFSVTPNGTRVRVDRLTPAPFAQDLGSVEKVVVQANGGDDTIAAANGLATLTQLTLDGGAGADNIIGGDGNDVILGGDDGDTIAPGRGNDLALMGAGDDKATWNPGDGSDTLEGQSGNDTMDFNGSNAGEHIDLSANGGRLRLFRDVAAITMDVDDIERIDLAALGGADTITAGDLSGTDLTAVIADLASSPGGATGDGQPDHVIATGTNGDDAISISGSSGDVLVSGMHAGIGIRHAEPTDSLSIHTLEGADSVNSGGLAGGTIQLDTD